MDQRSPKGVLPPAVKGGNEKRPWASPVLKRLDVGLTSARSTGKRTSSSDYISNSSRS